MATEVLFAGLHFSPYYTLEQIIENEFANVVLPERAADFALRLLQSDSIRDTIAKYEPGDDFDGSPEYDQLYTELIGVIIDLLECVVRRKMQFREEDFRGDIPGFENRIALPKGILIGLRRGVRSVVDKRLVGQPFGVIIFQIGF